MNTKAILYAGVIGTTIMTIFSYILSAKRKKNFKEPQLLQTMINRMPGVKEKDIPFAGWLVHYATGVSWALLFAMLFKKRGKNITLYQEIIFGLCNGTAAIVIWKGFLSLHSHPPVTDRKEFYIQLIAAHIVFSVVMAEIYKRRILLRLIKESGDCCP
jgi:hypothetical protein